MRTFSDSTVELLKLNLWLLVIVIILVKTIFDPVAPYAHLIFSLVAPAGWVLLDKPGTLERQFKQKVTLKLLIGVALVLGIACVIAISWEWFQEFFQLKGGAGVQVMSTVLLFGSLYIYISRLRALKT